MVKDHSDIERGNVLLSLHGLLFLINSKVVFYMRHPTDRIAHTMAFVLSVMWHWLEQKNSSMDASIQQPTTDW